jgi:hypothetical protein
VIRWTGVILGVAAGLFYLLVGHQQSGTDSHYLFAQAFLDGRLHVEGSYPWLELVPRESGGWLSPFPPLLSVLLLPFAALGVEVDTNHIAAFMGGVTVALMWAMLGRLSVMPRMALALTVAWALGSQLLWIAGEGGQHLAPQVTAAALLLGAITLGLGRQYPWLAGLLLGAAAAARLPVGLALPLILWLYRPRHSIRSSPGGHPWLLVLAGVAIPAILVAAYNAARFGSALEFGYGLIRNEAGESVLAEWWYSEGIVSLSYLPNGLYTMLFSGFEFRADFPWIYAGIGGASVLLTMPILWWVVEARGRLALVAAISVVLVMLPNLMHGNPGFAQIGYRFILDALPILWLMLGLAFRESMSRAAAVALGAGVVINLWLATVFWTGLTA